MIKSMVVGFCFLVFDATLSDGVWNLIIYAQFQRSRIAPGLFQDFMDGYKKP